MRTIGLDVHREFAEVAIIDETQTDGIAGDNYTFGDNQGLFRYFGDSNGDRRVDIADFGLFSTSYGLHIGQSGFLAYFDYNNDGTIDIVDFGQFAIRMFTVLP